MRQQKLNLKRVSKGMFADKVVAIYEKNGERYLSLNEIAECIGIALGGGSLTRYFTKSRLVKCSHNKKQGIEYEYYAPKDDVLDYLKRSRKKASKNLYGALTFMLKEYETQQEGAAKQTVAPSASVAKKRQRQPASLVPVEVDGKTLMMSPADAYYTKKQQEKDSQHQPEEVPGFYFSLRQFFEPSELPVQWAHDNYKALTQSVTWSMAAVLELAEHTRGELRCKISSVVECLSDFQSILNGIQKATIVGSARAAV